MNQQQQKEELSRFRVWNCPICHKDYIHYTPDFRFFDYLSVIAMRLRKNIILREKKRGSSVCVCV